jgi:phenylacetic acid degradation operon negative regulatory protein
VAVGTTAPTELAGHRPQSLMFSLLGGLVVDHDVPAVPSMVVLDVFGALGVAEAAARATLKRMTHRGLLHRIQVGRTAHYRPTPAAEEIVRQARVRILSPAPFDHPDGEWTLLSYSVPESQRHLRHQVRARLTWAGFGGLRDGLWIAPGTADVAALFADGGLGDAAGLADAFTARPMPGTDIAGLVRRAWDVPAVRQQHERFIATWADSPPVAGDLAGLTLIGADWLRLLRADPGLPARHLGPDWPAPVSSAVYRRNHDAMLPGARRQLERLLAESRPRGRSTSLEDVDD